MHSVGSWYDLVPEFRIYFSALVQDPEEETHGHIAIISPVTNEIA